MTPSGTNVINTSETRRSLPRIGRKLITFVPAVSVAVMVTGGCSSSHPAASTLAPARPDPTRTGGVQRVTIAATDSFKFGPADVVVHPGKVALTLIDAGSYPHNISLPALGRTSPSVSGAPGQSSTTMLLTLATPGRYAFVCTYHSSAGMKGTLVVLQGS